MVVVKYFGLDLETLDKMLEEDFKIEFRRDLLSVTQQDYKSISKKSRAYRTKLEESFLSGYAHDKELVKCFNYNGVERLKRVLSFLEKTCDSHTEIESKLYEKYKKILSYYR